MRPRGGLAASAPASATATLALATAALALAAASLALAASTAALAAAAALTTAAHLPRWYVRLHRRPRHRGAGACQWLRRRRRAVHD